jgi:hypothetical protein
MSGIFTVLFNIGVIFIYILKSYVGTIILCIFYSLLLYRSNLYFYLEVFL